MAYDPQALLVFNKSYNLNQVCRELESRYPDTFVEWIRMGGQGKARRRVYAFCTACMKGARIRYCDGKISTVREYPCKNHRDL